MFCANCGVKIDENVKFCPQCGAPTQAEPQPQQQPVQEATPQVTPAVVENIPAEPIQEVKHEPAVQQPIINNVQQPNTPAVLPKKKKKKTGLIIGIVSTVIIIALAVTALLNLGSIKNLFVKMTTSDEGYVQHVYEKQTNDIAESIGNFITSLSTPKQNVIEAADAEIKIELGDKTIALLEEALNMELDWVKNAAIAYNVNTDGNLTSMDMDLKLNDKKVVSVDMIIDMENQELYLNVDGIMSKPIRISFAEMTDGSYPAMDAQEIQEMANKILGSLPDGEVIESIINRYSGVILGCIEEVEKESDKLEIGDVSLKCEKYTFKIDEKFTAKVVKAILKEAKDDKELKNMIKDLINSEGLSDIFAGVDADEVIEEFEEGIGEGLDEVSAEMFGEFDVDLSVWVNSVGDIIGMEIEVEEGKFSFLAPESGKKNALEIKLEAEGTKIVFSGSGVKSGNKLNGKYTLKAMNMKIFEIALIDYDTKTAENGYPNGAIEITPAKDIVSMITSGMGDAPASIQSILSSELKLRLDFQTTEKTTNFGISILSDNKSLIKLSMDTETKQKTSVKLPSNAVDLEDIENPEDILSVSGTAGFFEKFVEAGVPRDLIDSLFEDGFEFGGSSSSEVARPDTDWDNDWDDNYDYNWDGGYDELPAPENSFDYDFDYEYPAVETGLAFNLYTALDLLTQ